jgi:peptide/nickel transport system substrate-binding protein
MRRSNVGRFESIQGSLPRRRFLGLALGVTTASVLAACSQAAPVRVATVAPTQAPAAVAKTTSAERRIIIHEEIETLDPAATYGQFTNVMISHTMDPLVQFVLRGDAFQPVGYLAESWEPIMPTGYRFVLRSGIKFHNGRPITAEDVKYSLERYQDPKVPRNSLARPIKSVAAPDARTIEITTDGSPVTLLRNLTQLYVLPREEHQTDPAAFGRQPIGSGPYRVASWTKGQELRLEANSEYWGGTPTPAVLRIRSISDPTTRAAELKAGSSDIATNMGVAQIATIDSGDTEVVPVKGGRTIYYPFNTTKPPFDNIKVRQAANYAVDRATIVKSVLQGYGVVLSGMFTPGWEGFDSALQPYPYDPNKAKQLLAEAGLSNGFETTWNITTGVFLKDREISEAVASQLGKVGIKVNLVPEDRARLQAEVTKGEFDGITSGAWGTQADPDPMLTFLYAPDRALHNKPLWALADQARKTTDPVGRADLYRQVNALAHDEALWLFVHGQDELYGKRKDVDWAPYFTTASKAYVYFFKPANP